MNNPLTESEATVPGGRPNVEAIPASCPLWFPSGTSAARRGLDGVAAALERLVNGSLALVFLGLALPVLTFVALLILLTDGPPVLYRDRRLGRGKRPFLMFKFRTLVRGARNTIGGELHSHKHGLEIRCGRFLRDTRLDELPQLLNVARGDMNLFGPRPERPEVYESRCRHIPGYHQRFAVKPGIVGLSQLFTPHAAPKRLRAFVDRRGLSERSPARELFLLGYAAVAMARAAITRVVRLARDELLPRLGGRPRNRRALRRRRPRRTTVRVITARYGLRGRPGPPLQAPLVDINEEALRLDCASRLPGPGALVALRIDVRFRRKFRPWAHRMQSARCTGRIHERRPTAEGWAYVIHYTPAGEFSRYVVEQYLLDKSLSGPFTS